MTDSIANAINNAVSYLTEHPDEAAYTDSPATATLEGGLKVKVVGSEGESLSTDMPTSVGGDNSAPSAGWMMRAALAACEATLIAMRAAQQGVALSTVEVTVDSQSDDRGILGIDPSVPAGPASVRVQVKASGDAPDADIKSVVQWAHEHCPVSDAVRREVPMELEIG